MNYGIISNPVPHDKITFSYPGNRHIYVPFTRQLFQKYIFSCIRSVRDCYVLCSCSAKDEVGPFEQHRFIQLDCDSDKENDCIDHRSQEMGRRYGSNERDVKQSKIKSGSADEVEDDIVHSEMKKVISSHVHDSDTKV